MKALNLVARPGRERSRTATLPSEEHPFALLADARSKLPPLRPAERRSLALSLAEAICELSAGATGTVTLRFDASGEVWEAGLETCRRDVLVSLYRPSPAPRLVTHERRVARAQLVESQIRRLEAERARAPRGRAGAAPRSIEQALRRLRESRPMPEPPVAARARREALGPRIDGLCFSAVGNFKLTRPGVVDCPRVERSDLHSLLVEGTLAISASNVRIRSNRSQLFLDAERLLRGAEQVLSTWETGRMLAARVQLSELELSLHRSSEEGRVEVAVSGPREDLPRRRVHVLSVASLTWVRAICHFVAALGAAYCSADSRQHRNLRLLALQRQARTLLERACADEGALENDAPDRYRRSARPRRSMVSGIWERGGKMRFSARWMATVPGLDLRATFLCGTSVIVDSSRETACIDRVDGKILWRAPSGPAACTVSPAGLVRFRPDGHLSCIDVATGERRFSLQLTPRPGGGAAGSLVHGDGLPRLLALTEGDRQISAVDIATGELKWRHTTARPGSFRLRRVGRLLLVAGGNGTLSALDLETGAAVWRYCSRFPFSGSLAVDAGSVVAISGVPGGWQVQHLDPWTGRLRWSAELAECPLPGRHPLLAPDVVVVPVGDERSAGAEAFCRRSGRSLWRQRADLASATSAWIACEDLIIVNDAAGVLTCLEARTGRVSFNHVFAGSCDADTPRRLEPVLRHGALFVPQQQVHVVRPRSGEIIGSVPPDLVPDLLRVDERCDVYVGEESGHLAAFAAAPQLALVG